MEGECTVPQSLERTAIHNTADSTSNSQDETDLAATRRNGKIPENKRVHWFWDIVALGSILTFIADIGSDLFVAVLYFRHGQYSWCGCTLGFVLLSSFTLQIFSAKWFYEDEKKETWLTYVLHFVHIGPVLRYWRVFRSGCRTRRNNTSPTEYQYFLREWRDICMLRLFEAYIESAPQLVLQLYILSYHRRFNTSSDIFTVVTAICSLVSLAWSIVAYSSALRDVVQDKVSWTGFFIQILWRLFMLASRITALVLFVSFFNVWLIIAIGIHWLFMFLFLIMQYSTFCSDSEGNVHPCREVCYNGIIAFVYIFSFFNITEGATRLRLFLYYTLNFIEATVFVVLWYPHRALFGDVSIAAITIVFGGFLAGLFFMVIYYQFYHPNIVHKGFCFKRGSEEQVHKDSPYTSYWCCCCEIRAIRNAEVQNSPLTVQQTVPVANGQQTLPVANGTANRTLQRTVSSIHPMYIDLDIIPRTASTEHVPHLLSPSQALYLKSRGRVEVNMASTNSLEHNRSSTSLHQPSEPMWI